MEIDQFWYILKTGYGYQSSRTCRFLVKKFPFWATFIYYVQLVYIILIESITAHKGTYDRKTWARGSLCIVKIVESAGGRLHVSGLKGVAEHQEPLVYNSVTFVVKKGLLRYPVFGSIIRAIHPIAVTRQNPREDLKLVLTRGQTLISQGCSIMIFPQATRSAVFDVASFNSLGVKLARKAGVAVVPVALKTDFQGNGRILKDMGAVDPSKELYIKFGEPIPVKGNGQETHQQIVTFITENLTAWGAKVNRNIS
ncbi:MAG: 1-acyl-sn-glycerol-3-phosphate acyltransferase [Deltaproteobacteria bacterium]|nr:1-acyl-sn-glycerol-3-phosphate acyltransferase [Deltaproteobacteria bacterium]